VKRASSRGHELSTHQDEVQASTSLQQPPAPSQGNENEDCDTTSNDTSSGTAASSVADGTDNTADSTHVVRVKQEDTTTNDNTQQQQVSIKQEQDNTYNNNEDNDEEEGEDELVNTDDVANEALNVLLGLDVGSLLSPDLKSKIMKVQDLCGNNDDAPSLQQQISAMKEIIQEKDGIIKDIQDKNNILKDQLAASESERTNGMIQGQEGALVASDSSTKPSTKEQTSPSVLSDESDAIIASNSAGNTSVNGGSSSEDESNLKPAANPLIGSNVQVQSGKHKGMFGKVLSDKLGWVKIEPEYKLGSVKMKPVDVPELNVRIENCKLVNDGKADINVIEQYFAERTRQMMEVIQPDQIYVLEEEDDGSIVAGKGPNGGADELIDSENDDEITRMQARIAKSRKASNYESDKGEDVSDKERVAAAIEAVNTKYGVGLKRQKMLESSGHRGVTWTPQGHCK